MPKNLLSGLAPDDEMSKLKVHNIIRWISPIGATDPQGNFQAVWEIDKYVSAWVNEGWKLFATHFIGTAPEGFGVLYIMTRE